MPDPVKKAHCIAWFIETTFGTQIQRNYQMKYKEMAPSCSSICDW